MAEFQEVIKQTKRMCVHFSPMCNGCPLGLEKGTNEFCGEQPLDIRSDLALVEAAVMQWAAEHPEPKYPTWEDFLESVGLGEFVSGTARLAWLRETHIPADIAEKLGIEPKEDV